MYESCLHTIESTSSIAPKVKESIANLNNPLVLLASQMRMQPQKFSAISEDTLATGLLSYQTEGICYANCQNGYC